MFYLVTTPQWMPHDVDDRRETAEARLAINTMTNVIIVESTQFV